MYYVPNEKENSEWDLYYVLLVEERERICQPWILKFKQCALWCSLRPTKKMHAAACDFGACATTERP
jgi:hypothetical protein